MEATRLIRRARLRAGLTLRQLAERAGTSNSTLSAYESGRVVPRADTLTRIVEAAGWHLTVELDRAPVRDPQRRPAGEELWEAMLLAEMLPRRRRDEWSPGPHAIFGRS